MVLIGIKLKKMLNQLKRINANKRLYLLSTRLPSTVYGLRSKKGFTLVEMLLYFAILSLVILAISSFTYLSYQSRIKASVIAEVEQQGNQTMDIILQNIRNASAITVPAAASSGSSLSLTHYNAGVSPAVFDLSAGTIRITEGAGAAVNITSNRLTASGLSFQNLTPGTAPGNVRVQFTLTHNNPSGRGEYSYSKTFTAAASLRQP